jgi:predicted PhzF superfamily epimerase YddE/YHI9
MGACTVKLKLWQVDAFATGPFEGNPAAIVPLEFWLDAALMQKIANENNLAETAFFVRRSTGRYDLRWFTPEAEVELCGHATLASAWTIFEFLDSDLKQVAFETKAGTLTVDRAADGYNTLSMPSESPVEFADARLAPQISQALDSELPALTLESRYLIGVWNRAADVRGLQGPGDIERVLRPRNVWGFVATAPGDEGYDFVSRFFAPDKGVPEDPVTGSAHCALTPYWAKRLGKKTLKARQVSPRGGDLICTDAGERTILAGPCAHYMTAEITV